MAIEPRFTISYRLLSMALLTVRFCGFHERPNRRIGSSTARAGAPDATDGFMKSVGKGIASARATSRPPGSCFFNGSQNH
jgi:hypothetical protein